MDFIGATGYQPVVMIGKSNPERKKYERVWEREEYRNYSPAQNYVRAFVTHAKPKWGSHVIDFGCGTGRASLSMCEAGLRVTMVDFASNCLDKEVREFLSEDLKFVRHDLTERLSFVSEYGFCCDVMEHIPEDQVDIVLSNIMAASKMVFFAIFNHKDQGGALIGETLHLTVKPASWWRDKLQSAGMDITWEGNHKGAALFYGSAWEDLKELSKHGVVNVDDMRISENLTTNSKGPWQDVRPYDEQETEVMILGGGPTLTEFEDDIREMRANGVKLVTLNGTYNWCLERSIVPSATVLVDARPFNSRFVRPVHDKVKYFISGQCDPSVFEGLPPENTYIWYDSSDRTKEILEAAGKEGYFPIVGGSTVLLRALPLLRLLGYKRFHLFGCDSCLMAPSGSGKGRTFHHHAFPQTENDDQSVIPVMLTGGKVFYCNPWMAMQAREFLEIVKMMGDHIDMIVYGGGLLSNIINTGAELAPELEE